jgi:hypothetical protein
MHSEALIGIASMSCFLIAIITAAYMQRTKIVHILDYQVGLRFRRGETYRELPPGCYRTGPGLSPITVVDMRPRQFLLERLTYKDALLSPSVISVAGELIIANPQTATNAMKDVVADSLSIVRERLCLAASHLIVDPTSEGKGKLGAAITSEINLVLQSSGVMIRNLEITELWAPPMKYAVASEAN